MNKHDILKKVSELIRESPIAVFAAVHKESKPHISLMKPAIIPSETDSIFTLTPLHFLDELDLINHPEGEWMIQNKAIDEIINVKGEIDFFSNPTVNSEVMKAMGGHLLYWEDDKRRMEYLVMEMTIKSIHYFLPITGKHELVHF